MLYNMRWFLFLVFYEISFFLALEIISGALCNVYMVQHEAGM